MISLNFCGDTSFTGCFHHNLVSGLPSIDSDVASYLSKADYTVLNLEGPTTNSPSKRKDIQVTSPPESIEYLKNVGVTHCNIANNHIFDSGVEGFNETINLIKAHSLVVSGINEDNNFNISKVKLGDVSVALISISQFFNNMSDECIKHITIYDKRRLKVAINQAKLDCNWEVLSYHGGEEYTIYPWKKRRKLLKSFLNMGADVVVCHHSHTVQPFECFGDNKYIFYSLGNFIFDLENHRNKSFVNDSLILNLRFDLSGINIGFLPLTIDTIKAEVKKGADISKLFYEINLDEYPYKAWNFECARVVKERNKSTGSVEDDGKLKRIIPIVKKLFVVVTNSEFRAIALGYMKHRLGW